ncbi:MAG TPA: hypothetical protein VFS28_03345 [Gemmatimonadales bacterium]|nr:hypothetical protein [Gemmatimonadales bacterium]
MRPFALFSLLVTVVATPLAAQSKYLFAWTGDSARQVSDFLAVIDADPASATYGHVLTSVAVGATATLPHHTEYTFPADSMLLANGWAAGRTYLFDLRHPTAPRVATSFTTVGGFSFPHSFARLPNGHLIGTFQGTGGRYGAPGGLVELDERGHLLRSASAVAPGVADTLAWPYSLALDPAHDRAVVTVSTMPIPSWLTPPAGSWTKARADRVETAAVQVWRISDLHLLATVPLPARSTADTGDSAPQFYPAEPMPLPDGSFYVNTFNCGLFHVTGLDGPAPAVRLIHVFPTAPGTSCAVPAIVGHYWIQTVPSLPGLIALDLSDPADPIEVSRLTFDLPGSQPHWMAADAAGSRVVVTFLNNSQVVVVNVDPKTGFLSVDRNFRDERTGRPGVDLGGRTWPQGAVARAYPHGTLFGPR